jgi:hypothetical protein
MGKIIKDEEDYCDHCSDTSALPNQAIINEIFQTSASVDSKG